MARALGVICEKKSIQYSCVADPGPTVEVESDATVPASIANRAEQLAWLLDEAREIIRRRQPDVIYVKRSLGGGLSQVSHDRYEVEAVVQVAAHHEGVRIEMKLTEQIRGSHVRQAKGAYEALLRRADVAERSNASKRERYLYAVTALKDLAG